MKIFDEADGIGKFIPYSSHVSSSVVKTDGGDYLIVWAIKGFPFVGREAWELEHRHTTFNRLLQSLRAPDYPNISFWIHDIRRKSQVKISRGNQSGFNLRLTDEYFQKLNQSKLLENELFLTLIYKPTEKKSAFSSIDSLPELEKQLVAELSKVEELAAALETSLVDYEPYRLGIYENSEGIGFSETLEFFGFLINHVNEPVPVLNSRINHYLPTSEYIFNEKTGNHLIKTANGDAVYGTALSIREFPDGTYPGILNSLKFLNFEYIITHSFSPESRYDAIKTLQRTKSRLLTTNDKSVTQIAELDEALDGVSSGDFLLGSYHFSAVLYADSLDKLDAQVSEMRSVLSNSGFVSVRETFASMGAVFAQFPCNWVYRTRKAHISSLNFLGLTPLHNFATGKPTGNPWGEAVTILQTINSQPFYFNFHATRSNEESTGQKALGNTIVIGKSGTGKTVLINFLLSQVQRLTPSPTIFFFDKDRGAEIFIRACGGNYLALENGVSTGFNPLQCENNQDNTLFLVNFVKMLTQKNEYSASEEEDITRAVIAILDAPKELRTMTNLQSSLPNLGENSVYSRLRKWTRAGYLGWVFDNPTDMVAFDGANIIGFDYTDLIDNSEVRIPVITYLIRRMEELIDGRPFIYVMDEFWKILEGEGGLKEFAKNKLKTIRKQNGLGIFATQSPEDALKSDIAADLIEQTATLILLPNPNADEKDYVEGLKLSKAEYQEVKRFDENSRCFLVKQGHHSAACQLKLQDMQQVLSVISASTDNIRIVNALLEKHGNQTNAARSAFNRVDPALWLDEFFESQVKNTQTNPHN